MALKRIYKATGLLGRINNDEWEQIDPPYIERQKKTLILEHDKYREPVTEDRIRARGCRHKIPCLTFKCISSHHRGPRATPWCRGCDDRAELIHLMGQAAYDRMSFLSKEDLGWCDECWCRTMRGFVEKRVRDLRRWRKHSRLAKVGLQSIKEYRKMLWRRGTWLPEDPKNK